KLRKWLSSGKAHQIIVWPDASSLGESCGVLWLVSGVGSDGRAEGQHRYAICAHRILAWGAGTEHTIRGLPQGRDAEGDHQATGRSHREDKQGLWLASGRRGSRRAN